MRALIPILAVAACLAGCAAKPPFIIVPARHVQMCADKGTGGVVHVSPCNPLDASP
jgi:hypothetical protein